MWFIRPKFTKSIAKKAIAAIKPVVKVAAWKFNKYGTKYRAENGTFVNGNQPIQAYYVGPFIVAKNKAGKLPAGASVKYDEVMVQDGHVWIGYTADDGKRIYLPVRPHVNGMDGKAWGTFK